MNARQLRKQFCENQISANSGAERAEHVETQARKTREVLRGNLLSRNLSRQPSEAFIPLTVILKSEKSERRRYKVPAKVFLAS